MKRVENAFEVGVETTLSAFDAAQWDACAGAGSPEGRTPNPFVSHAFLSALEESGSVGGRSGWSPAYLAVRDVDGGLRGAAPSYLKAHSQGEYVFDHGWAEACMRAGGRYYPKMQVAVPFTPATGPRLLAGSTKDSDRIRDLLARGLRTLCDRTGASSVHATFLEEHDAAALTNNGYLLRTDRQFHWSNAGYSSYDDFLGALASRKRKALKRERRDALCNGITIESLTGSSITEADWDAFFAFYTDTGSRKWGRPYLTRAFFSIVGERMADRILLVIAKRDGRPIAGAINFIGDDALYGRNWGCIEDHPFLHFEVCYHRAIDFAIERGLERVEAGAQGEHKLARGYLPVVTRSAHWIADLGLRRAVAEYLERENLYVASLHAELETASPFRRDCRDDD
jgi:predicted N-acyltransferase